MLAITNGFGGQRTYCAGQFMERVCWAMLYSFILVILFGRLIYGVRRLFGYPLIFFVWHAKYRVFGAMILRRYLIMVCPTKSVTAWGQVVNFALPLVYLCGIFGVYPGKY